MRAMPRITLLLLLLTVLRPSTSQAEVGARLLDVKPMISAEDLVGHLRLTGLPTPKQLQSMRSGLVSAVDLELVLVDDHNDVVAGHRFSLRLAFDLWEQFFSVTQGEGEIQFSDLESLRSYLAEVTTPSIAKADELPAAGAYKLKVGLTVHAVAPDERARVADTLAGESRHQRKGPDSQEASVSLGLLIRLFYKGNSERTAGQEARSAWFHIQELDHATH